MAVEASLGQNMVIEQESSRNHRWGGGGGGWRRSERVSQNFHRREEKFFMEGTKLNSQKAKFKLHKVVRCLNKCYCFDRAKHECSIEIRWMLDSIPCFFGYFSNSL